MKRAITKILEEVAAAVGVDLDDDRGSNVIDIIDRLEVVLAVEKDQALERFATLEEQLELARAGRCMAP